MRVSVTQVAIPLVAVAVVLATVATAQRFIPPGPAPPSTAPATPSPPRQAPQDLIWAIAEMGQFDMNTLVIQIPPGVNSTHPTLNNITYPQSAIEYGYWVNETIVRELIANKSAGSFFNSPSAGSFNPKPPTPAWWRDLQTALHEWSKDNTPVLYGLDSVHGVNYAFGATLFPQQIGVAATFNPAHAFAAGNVTMRESRYIGIPWTFAPILGVATQPAWPRVYETYGEDPFLASIMADAVVRGVQQPPPADMFPELCGPNGTRCPAYAVAACMKHFIGYSNSRTGRDRTPAWIPDNFLLEYFMPSFQAAVNAGVLSTMENYIEVNGRPVVMSELYLSFLLRTVMRFEGMLVTDYNEIMTLYDFHSSATSYDDAVFQAINRTTIDMGMIAGPQSYPDVLVNYILKNWEEGKISSDRIRASAARVIDMKGNLGLLNGDSPVPPPQTLPVDAYRTYSSTPAGQTCFFGCPEHHAAAYAATRDSMTLLQNDGILPLNPTSLVGKKVALVGRGCNSVPIQAGGWTIHWQGSTDPTDFPYGLTVSQGIAAQLPGANIAYSPGCDLKDGSECTADEILNATSVAANASVVIVCVGEHPYAEVLGDIHDLTLPGGQIGMVDAIWGVNQNIVTVLIEGRPRVLKTIPGQSRAVLHAYLPGPFGGQAIAETLVGIHNPSGRLPITYPKHLNDGPLQYYRKYSANQFNDFDVQWEFGHGLSYTNFLYMGLSTNFLALANFSVNVTVMNAGSRAGTDTVLLFVTQKGRPMPADVKRLVAVQRVTLEPKATQTIVFSFSFLELGYYDEVGCEYVAVRPTFAIVGTDAPFATGNTIELPLNVTGSGVDNVINLNNCPLGPYFKAKMLANPFAPTGSPSPIGIGEGDDYFMSSVVCFVGGVIATCFLVFFVRRKNRHMRSDAVQLFEPSGV